MTKLAEWASEHSVYSSAVRGPDRRAPRSHRRFEGAVLPATLFYISGDPLA